MLFVSHRVLVSPLLAVVLALSLAGCGSSADTGADTAAPTAAGGAADGGGADEDASRDCPEKHAVTVQDEKFGGTADIDLCARPEVRRTAVSAAWTSVYERPSVCEPAPQHHDCLLHG